MKNNFKLLVLAISLASIYSINCVEHTPASKTIKIYTSKYKIPVGNVNLTNLYIALSKVPENEKEAVQVFFKDINDKALKALSSLTEKYATKTITFQSFNAEIQAIFVLANNSINAFNQVQVSNQNLKELILFEYQRVILDIVKNFIATGEKINSAVSEDLSCKKKTVLANYKEITDIKSKL
ncbi:MAG: hypothetical protein P4L22_04235 [Candidatus Babeliales bacterium]|nr:hypothetical protein [Candidatus Babeliales bacterium]